MTACSPRPRRRPWPGRSSRSATARRRDDRASRGARGGPHDVLAPFVPLSTSRAATVTLRLRGTAMSSMSCSKATRSPAGIADASAPIIDGTLPDPRPCDEQVGAGRDAGLEEDRHRARHRAPPAPGRRGRPRPGGACGWPAPSPSRRTERLRSGTLRAAAGARRRASPGRSGVPDCAARGATRCAPPPLRS